MKLTNCEVSLSFTWSAACVIRSKDPRDADPDVDLVVVTINGPTGASFSINDAKLYVPIVTLWTQDDSNLLRQLKTGFKRIVRCSKYRSKISNQIKNNNLNYLIDSAFNKVNRLFVLSFENEDDWTTFSKYYISTAEIKDYNVFI